MTFFIFVLRYQILDKFWLNNVFFLQVIYNLGKISGNNTLLLVKQHLISKFCSLTTKLKKEYGSISQQQGFKNYGKIKLNVRDIEHLSLPLSCGDITNVLYP